MNFEIGQIFEGEFPKDAYSWCFKQGGCYVKTIEPLEDGTLRFQIVSIEEHPFFIDQIFVYEYPPEAAVWCNEHGDRYIDEIEPVGGVQRFQIVAVPEPTDEEIASRVRAERARKVAATDYLAMPDYPPSEEGKVAVMAYRQALRDIPSQEGFPREVVWPEVPAAFKRTQG